MAELALLGYMVYGTMIYMLAYLLYLLFRSASPRGGLCSPSAPYDSKNIILKRRIL